MKTLNYQKKLAAGTFNGAVGGQRRLGRKERRREAIEEVRHQNGELVRCRRVESRAKEAEGMEGSGERSVDRVRGRRRVGG